MLRGGKGQTFLLNITVVPPFLDAQISLKKRLLRYSFVCDKLQPSIAQAQSLRSIRLWATSVQPTQSFAAHQGHSVLQPQAADDSENGSFVYQNGNWFSLSCVFKNILVFENSLRIATLVAVLAPTVSKLRSMPS